MSFLPLILATAMTASGAFPAANGLLVQPTDPDSFSVPYAGLSAPTDFWCAAGDYTLRVLGKPAKTLIYRTSSSPRRSGEGMTFSLNPADSAGKSGLTLLGGAADGVTAALAKSLCAKMDGD